MTKQTIQTKDITAMLHRLPVLRTITGPSARTESERLAAELADYRTEADRNDLNALLDEYSDDAATAQVRDLLNRPAFVAA